MSRPFGPAAFLALTAIACSSAAAADTPARSQVTIRGTGTNVTIERAGPPIGKRSGLKRPLPVSALDEAVALKAAGADDSAVLSDLRAHQSELPVVVDAEQVRRLRRAGAGKSVFAYLATVSALDIGPTGEGRESTPPATELPAYEMPYAYSLGFGYGAPFPGRFPRHRRFASPRVFFQHGHPVSRRVFSPHLTPAHRPVM